MPRLRVLLLSPVASRDPGNGDVTYTEQLLAHEPASISYVPYDEALRTGALVERFRRSGASTLGALRREPRRAAFVREMAINRARRTGLLFREPFRHFEVQEGHFDLIHVHVFNVSLGGARLPVVLSNSVPVDAVYRDGLGQAPTWVARRQIADRWLAGRTGVMHAAYDHRSADAVVCFSETLRTTFQRTVAARGRGAQEYVVISPGVDRPEVPPPGVAPDHFHVGFIGHWEAKGGPVVLAAYRNLVTDGSPVRLTVVGTEPRLGATESQELGITWLPRQSREGLLASIIPSLSAFAYPSHFDGLPLTLLEVMAAGVPTVVSDYGALPEVVQQGRSGLVVPVGDVTSMTAALRRLRDDPQLHHELSEAGRARTAEHYSAVVSSTRLAELYASVTKRAGRRPVAQSSG